jgi:hypothetical protein
METAETPEQQTARRFAELVAENTRLRRDNNELIEAMQEVARILLTVLNDE